MTESTVVEALRKSRKNIKDGWTQGSFARTASGITTDPSSPEAVEWCAYGAIFARLDFQQDAHWLLSKAVWKIENNIKPDQEDISIPTITVVAWNDQKGRTKEQVLAAFDLAIELAQKKESNDKNSNAT